MFRFQPSPIIDKFKEYSLPLTIIFATLLFSVITYSFFVPSNLQNDYIFPLILIDLVLFMAITIALTRKIFYLWSQKKQNSQGSRLHTKIILMFSAAASVPTIIVAMFSALLFHYGIESWFNHTVSTAITESLAVTDAYLAEHKRNIRHDILAMKEAIDSEFFTLIHDPNYFAEKIAREARLRSLIEVMVFQQNKVLIQGSLSFALAFERLPLEELSRADQGEIIITTTEMVDKVRALIKLDSFPETYLLIGRLIDDKVSHHIHNTQEAVNKYHVLKRSATRLQVEFSFTFLIIALLLLSIAIWFGIKFSGNIIRPISKLIEATDRIKSGDLSCRVEEGPANDEIAVLAKAFNLMTEQLEQQHNKLIEATKQINIRRLFTETVLSGVSAGVIALEVDTIISLVNKSALALLNATEEQLIGHSLHEVIPEFSNLFIKAPNNVSNQLPEEITLQRATRKLVFNVRISAEYNNNDIKGYIITFDDITPLVFAQRTAAWSEVARRIAHEIKNPLTPISLAAQRLKRKFGNETSDPENFTSYTNTIIKHVNNINKIVEEFVNFARMPSPSISEQNICQLIRETIFSREVLDNKITYNLHLPSHPVFLYGDASQIHQALLNLYKNAEESIQERHIAGLIETTLEIDEKFIIITISDNGTGIQEELFSNLTKPYSTSKTIGTGLGLAIVKKILDDHNATVEFSNNQLGGLTVKLKFPYLTKG